jgi:formylglycine-generating enzyme required for sulfatase activity
VKRFARPAIRALTAAGVIGLLAGALEAAPAHAITYELVSIGDPGNANDVYGYGGVDHPYQIGKFEVTIGQYTAFLNAVAAADTYALYSTGMGAVANVAGISREGEPGSYTYAAMSNDGSSANRPISSVTWFNAARFANWMANGQPTGAQSDATTENGAYALNGATTGNAVARNAVNPNTGAAPTFFIPLENEWYKAAYYDPTLGGGSGGYTAFATRSDSAPDNVVGGAANQANYLTANGDYAVTQSGNYSSSQNYLTDVGTFTGSASYYGTFDQNGSLWEWNDLDGSAAPNRGLRGGAYTSTPPYLQSSYRMGYVPSGANANGGFRLAGPER